MIHDRQLPRCQAYSISKISAVSSGILSNSTSQWLDDINYTFNALERLFDSSKFLLWVPYLYQVPIFIELISRHVPKHFHIPEAHRAFVASHRNLNLLRVSLRHTYFHTHTYINLSVSCCHLDSSPVTSALTCSVFTCPTSTCRT